MIEVLSDHFDMGGAAFEEERPVHQEYVESIKMAQTETTFWQYHLYCKATE